MAKKKKRLPKGRGLISTMDRMRLLEEYLPAVHAFVRAGGTVETFLRKSTPVAYAKLAELMHSQDEAISFKATVEMLNRAVGKPVEKKQILYADVGELNERQIDTEILRYLKKDPELAHLISKPEQPSSEPQKRRPRVIDLDEK